MEKMEELLGQLIETSKQLGEKLDRTNQLLEESKSVGVVNGEKIDRIYSALVINVAEEGKPDEFVNVAMILDDIADYGDTSNQGIEFLCQIQAVAMEAARQMGRDVPQVDSPFKHNEGTPPENQTGAQPDANTH